MDPGEPRDYFREGLELAERQKYHEALTSFRLALRQRPDDVEILQQMGMIYTQIGMPEQAVQFYERALEVDPRASGARYGMAFLCLRGGDAESAREHLRAFLAHPPEGEEAAEHVSHARTTLKRLEGEAGEGSSPSPPAEE